MKVSLNWIRLMNANYGTSDSSMLDDVGKLIEKIGLQLGAVEEVINVGERYEGIVVAKVISVDKHPDADKLSVCMIDTGSAKQVQVVCGAPNVKPGQFVCWIAPGLIVPSTYDKERFVLESREIRGVMSNGMIASGKEMAINDDHEGILVIEEPATAGQSFAEAYRLNDFVIDIENKMFTHRPDCFGLLGIARELAGIYDKPFKSPKWYREDADLPADGRKNVIKLAVKNEIPKQVPRFCAVVIKDVKIAPSPIWLQSFLSRVGIRPINNIVDITNWFMLATSQPLHAYDYDKVKTGVLGVRLSKKGESLRLLGGKELTLDSGAIVITDGQKPIGLGGIMGGADTEVGDSTKNIIFECANFDMNLTRKTAMFYGLYTDAATRFTKNQSPRQNRAVLVKTVSDTLQIVGGRVASPLIDDKHFLAKEHSVKVTAGFIKSRLGLELTASEMKKLLENVEFKVKLDGDALSVTVPFWRTDISIPEDIVEEVGRLYGYDKLPVILPTRNLSPAPQDKLLGYKMRLRNILRRAGANEALTYSFVHGRLMQKVGQDPKDAYHIRNAVSPDLQYYRLSVTPSLLEKIHPNIRQGFDEFALFELGKGHNQKMKDKHGLPEESEMLSLVFASKSKTTQKNGAAYYQALRLLNYLADELGIDMSYRPIGAEEPYPVAKPFDHNRSAQVWAGDLPLGMVGEYKQSVVRALKLPLYCAGFEIGISQLLEATPAHQSYFPLNRFPDLEQDFCLKTSTGLTYQESTAFMDANLKRLCKPHGYLFLLEPLDIFQKPDDKHHKQTTWRIILWHPERTLTTEETNRMLDELAKRAKKEINAERI